MVEVRAGQDYVHKGEDERPARTTYRLSPEAWKEVDIAGSCAHQAATGEDLTDHERSFLARVAEHVTRVAAVLAYYRRARDGGDAVICLDDARDALTFVQSCTTS